MAAQLHRVATAVNHLPTARLGRWFFVLLFGFLLAGTLLPLVIVAFTVAGLSPPAWIAWPVLALCVAAVFWTGQRLVPPGTRGRRDVRDGS